MAVVGCYMGGCMRRAGGVRGEGKSVDAAGVSWTTVCRQRLLRVKPRTLNNCDPCQGLVNTPHSRGRARLRHERPLRNRARATKTSESVPSPFVAGMKRLLVFDLAAHRALEEQQR
eukprot:1704057-Rhodomonas_salina.2